VVHALLLAYSVLVEKDVLLRMSRTVNHLKLCGYILGKRLTQSCMEQQGEKKTPAVLVKTAFPFADSHFTVAIQNDAKGDRPVKVELYVGRYFDKEGYFHKENFTKDVETILSRFEKRCKQQ
jgi:hypothetical protein